MTTNLKTANIRVRYSRFDPDVNIINDFYVPLLKNAVKYDRHTGYFSSTILSAASQGFTEFCSNPNVQMRLIVGAKLHDADIKVIQESSARLKDRITKNLKDELTKALKASDFEKRRLQGLAWMLQNGILNIKVGIMIEKNTGREKSHREAEYHGKEGIVYDENDNSIHFIGGINESLRAWDRCGDVVSVHKSWNGGDYNNHIKPAAEEFELLWNIDGKDIKRGVGILDFSMALKEDWIEKFPPLNPSEIKEPIERYHDVIKDADWVIWPHKKLALEWFLNENQANGIGILQMATGTGKTWTALDIIKEMFDRDMIDAVVINTKDRLLKQWSKEMIGKTPWKKATFWENADKKEAGQFSVSGTKGRCLMITNYFLPDFLKMIPKEELQRTLLVVDEIHNIGAEGNRDLLGVNYKKFKYRLGLSATPFDEWDAARNQFIIDSFVRQKFVIKDIKTMVNELIDKEFIFNYGLEDAIQDGRLCPIEYHYLKYEPSAEERREAASQFVRWDKLAEEGKVLSSMPYIMAANVYKDSRAKIPLFEKFLEKNRGFLKNCIVFVNTTEFGREILPIIQKYTRDYRIYFSGDKEEHLYDFSRGDLDVLVTCHMISEGVDIKSVSNIVLFSCDRQRLELIQRMGRALRVDPSNPTKIAHILDFVYLQPAKPDSADTERKKWLKQLSNIRGK